MRRLLFDGSCRRRLAIAGAVLAGVVLLALLALATFPLGMFTAAIERRVSARVGTPVTIAAIERVGGPSLAPTVAIRGLRIPQPSWAGRGDLAVVDTAELTFPLLPALFGDLRLRSVTLSGVRLALVRTKDRRENWRGKGGGEREPDSGRPVLAHLSIRDMRVSYRDALRDRAFVISVAADPRRGLVGSGSGSVRGSPVQIAFRGTPVQRINARWPFRATIDGADLAMTATGTMASPLDLRHLSTDITARGRDLKMIDAIVEAGLFETGPVTLAAHVDRDPRGWTITGLSATIGQSRIAGRLTVTKPDGRTYLDGALTSDRLDFADFASPAGNAAAAAREQAIGLRLVPDTRINLAKVGKTDGRITFRIARIVDGARPSTIRAMAGVVTMDSQLLRIAPLTIGLPQGAIRGSVTIDQRGGVPEPRVTYDLRLAGSSIGALAGGGGSVTGRVDGRAYLVGRGSTIRETIARSDGRIGLVAHDGSLPTRIAAALGFDAGRAVLAGRDDRAGLRCVVAGFAMRRGTGRTTSFVVDTTQSQLRGEGTLTFPDEHLAIRLTGALKRAALLRLPGSATMAGTIREPDILVAPGVKSAGNILRAIGRAITGKQGPIADDADCAGLAERVLR